MSSGLPAKLLFSSSLGSLISSGCRPYRSRTWSRRAADDLLRRDAVDLLGIYAHEILAAAGDDVGLVAVGAQILHDLEHRLVDQLCVGPVPARMFGGRDPFFHLGGELIHRHAGERRAAIFRDLFMGSFAIASRSPESTVLKGSTSFNSGFGAATAGTRSRQ